jgi:uncharacterized protein
MKTDFGKSVSSSKQDYKPILPKGKGMTFLFLISNLLALILPHIVPGLHIPGTHWNWSGKIIAFALSCAVLGYSPWLRQNVGLQWRQSPGSLPISLLCLLLCLGGGIAFGFYYLPEAFSRETLLFELFMPTLDEELAFRGIASAMLEREYGQSPMDCRLRYGRAAFILSLVFGLSHAVGMANGHFNFDLLPLVRTFFFSSILMIARTRSGSLLWPMLCHSTWNMAFFAVAMMRS